MGGTRDEGDGIELDDFDDAGPSAPEGGEAAPKSPKIAAYEQRLADAEQGVPQAVARLDLDRAELEALWQERERLFGERQTIGDDKKALKANTKAIRAQDAKIKEKEHGVIKQAKFTAKSLKQDAKKHSHNPHRVEADRASAQTCRNTVQVIKAHQRETKKFNHAVKYMEGHIKRTEGRKAAQEALAASSQQLARMNHGAFIPDPPHMPRPAAMPAAASAPRGSTREIQPDQIQRLDKLGVTFDNGSISLGQKIASEHKAGRALSIMLTDNSHLVANPDGSVMIESPTPENAAKALSICLSGMENMEAGVDFSLDDNGMVSDITQSGLDKLGADWTPTPGQPASAKNLENLKTLQDAFVKAVSDDLKDGVQAKMDAQYKDYYDALSPEQQAQVPDDQKPDAGPSAAQAGGVNPIPAEYEAQLDATAREARHHKGRLQAELVKMDAGDPRANAISDTVERLESVESLVGEIKQAYGENNMTVVEAKNQQLDEKITALQGLDAPQVEGAEPVREGDLDAAAISAAAGKPGAGPAAAQVAAPAAPAPAPSSEPEAPAPDSDNPTPQ